MEYVLIVMWFAGYPVAEGVHGLNRTIAVAMQSFTSEQTCQAAAARMPKGTTAFCVKR